MSSEDFEVPESLVVEINKWAARYAVKVLNDLTANAELSNIEWDGEWDDDGILYEDASMYMEERLIVAMRRQLDGDES